MEGFAHSGFGRVRREEGREEAVVAWKHVERITRKKVSIAIL